MKRIFGIISVSVFVAVSMCSSAFSQPKCPQNELQSSGNIVSSSWQNTSDHKFEDGPFSKVSAFNRQEMSGFGRVLNGSGNLDMYLGLASPYAYEIKDGSIYGVAVMEASLSADTKRRGALNLGYSAYHTPSASVYNDGERLAARTNTATGFRSHAAGHNPTIDVDIATSDGYSVTTPAGKTLAGNSTVTLTADSRKHRR